MTVFLDLLAAAAPGVPDSLAPGAVAGGVAAAIVMAAQIVAKALRARFSRAEEDAERARVDAQHAETRNLVEKMRSELSDAMDAGLNSRREACKMDHEGIQALHAERTVLLEKVRLACTEALSKLDALATAIDKSALEDRHRDELRDGRLQTVLEALRDTVRELHSDNVRLLDKQEMLLKAEAARRATERA